MRRQRMERSGMRRASPRTTVQPRPASRVTTRAMTMTGVWSLISRVFFRQAEAGIRDLTVTGVQTCALPISPAIAYEAHLAAGVRVPAGATLRNPHEGDAAVAKNGASLFTAMNCDGCHGTDGSGWVGP